MNKIIKYLLCKILHQHKIDRPLGINFDNNTIVFECIRCWKIVTKKNKK